MNRLHLSFSTPLLCLFSLLILAGCASSSQKINLTTASELELYELAQKQISKGSAGFAIQPLQILEKRFPFGEYSKSAQLSLIYAYYEFNEPENAEAAANRFIRLHPQHRHVDYAYYMKGLISFPKAKTIFQEAFSVDLSKRDITDARLSFNQFNILVSQFPDSEYTPDSLKRMEFLRNLLARHEIHVANYYLERKAFIAATNRGQYVIENFQRTPAVPDALAVMVQGYYEMGMHDLSLSSLETLQANYPNHPALKNNGDFDYTYSTTSDSSWLNIATLGVLGTSKPPGFNSEDLYNKASQ